MHIRGREAVRLWPIHPVRLSACPSDCLLCLSISSTGYLTRMSRIAVGATATAVANHVRPASARHSRTCASETERLLSTEPCHIIDLFAIITSPSTSGSYYTHTLIKTPTGKYIQQQQQARADEVAGTTTPNDEMCPLVRQKD